MARNKSVILMLFLGKKESVSKFFADRAQAVMDLVKFIFYHQVPILDVDRTMRRVHELVYESWYTLSSTSPLSGPTTQLPADNMAFPFIFPRYRIVSPDTEDNEVEIGTDFTSMIFTVPLDAGFSHVVSTKRNMADMIKSRKPFIYSALSQHALHLQRAFLAIRRVP
jgi:hypothetical protein